MISASVCLAAEAGGELSGTVRDEHGVPQMGAVIELVGTGRPGIRTALTGLDGRYVFANLVAGTYRVRAKASFFRPVSTRGLHVGTGMEAVVNLTLASIYSAGTLLPAERRLPDEASDDWMWTMRSAASRPVLRLAGGTTAAQSENGSSHRSTAVATAGVGIASGGFGASGTQQMLSAGLLSADKTREISADGRFGEGSSAGSAGPVAIRVVTTRQTSPWSSVSTAVSFDSDAAVRPLGGGAAWHALRVASAETATFGDMAAIEVGGLLASDPSQPSLPASRPFARVRVSLPGEWTLEYAMATDRSFQRAADVTGLRDAGSSAQGIERIEHGRHQAVVLKHQSKTRDLAVSVYHDGLQRTPVLGIGSGAALGGVLQQLALLPGALVDGSNATFRAEGPGYVTTGFHVIASQQLSPDAWVELRFTNGAALGMAGTASQLASAGAPPHIRVAHGVAAGVAAHGRVRRSATALRASYEWQPQRTITPVDAFDALDLPAYLGFTVEQALPERLAPRGTMVRISASNVLRQGLRSVLAGDGGVTTLAQQLPSLQAGVGFTF